MSYTLQILLSYIIFVFQNFCLFTSFSNCSFFWLPTRFFTSFSRASLLSLWSSYVDLQYSTKIILFYISIVSFVSLFNFNLIRFIYPFNFLISFNSQSNFIKKLNLNLFSSNIVKNKLTLLVAFLSATYKFFSSFNIISVFVLSSSSCFSLSP